MFRSHTGLHIPSRADAEAAAGYDPEQPLDIIEQELEPPIAETKDLLSDPQAESPAEIVARKDLLAQMRKRSDCMKNV